eukprot:CAMPEP_0195520386 /NCGR_PEP_ID=MMETSP0794_2-20130614/16748_1 /TAXON_ID=515487 /ORGANISM="Stephanopyxis turris, Strain CCMP 815" /LENGTH=84 /DNA_ID=CAMNT_0040649731 /DNA_START=693 /DNA_END=947 /DNA_ORIENTATION=+
MTHGKYGAVKENTPKKDIRTDSFLRPQTYTIMKVKELPRKCTLTKGATTVMMETPKRSIMTKFAVLPRKSPSSSNRQYRTRKYI